MGFGRTMAGRRPSGLARSSRQSPRRLGDASLEEQQAWSRSPGRSRPDRAPGGCRGARKCRSAGSMPPTRHGEEVGGDGTLTIGGIGVRGGGGCRRIHRALICMVTMFTIDPSGQRRSRPDTAYTPERVSPRGVATQAAVTNPLPIKTAGARRQHAAHKHGPAAPGQERTESRPRFVMPRPRERRRNIASTASVAARSKWKRR